MILADLMYLNRELYLKAKFPFTTYLLFILFGFSCFAYVELAKKYLCGPVQTSQTGGQPYSEMFPVLRVL